MSYSKSEENTEMYLGLKSTKSAKANNTEYYYSAETNHTGYYYSAKSAKANHTDDAWAGRLDESVETPHTDAPHTDAPHTDYYYSAKSVKAPLTDILGKSSKGMSYTKSSKFLGDAKALKKGYAEHDAGTDDAWGAVEHPMMTKGTKKSGKSAKVGGKSAKKFGKSSKTSHAAIVIAHKS